MKYKFLLWVILCVCIHSNYAYAQTAIMRVWGEVFNKETGKPISGISMRMLKSLTRAHTDSTGEYYLVLSYPNDTLVFSGVGFEDIRYPISVNTRLPLIVRMQPSINTIDEVTVESGFQSIPKERATGSYSFIDSSLWNQRVGTNVVTRLEGLTNGLLINRSNPSDPTIQIRGLSSLRSESIKPLIVLDNFPFEGDLNTLNPNDIESISILKDAAATSIWGARAGNGVIVIKSKMPNYQQRIATSVTSNLTMSPKPNLFTANHMPVEEYIEMEKFLYEKGYYASRFTTLSKPPIPLVAELMEKKKLGNLSLDELEYELSLLKQQDYRNDLQKYFYRNAINQQYAANISGSSERIKYMISTGYDKNTEHLVGNVFQRFNLRSNNVVQLNNQLSVNLGVWMAFQNNENNSPGGYGDFAGISGYNSLATNEGHALPLDIYYRGYFTDTVGRGELLDWKYRPVQELDLNDKNTRSKDIIINWGMDYKWKYGLSANVKIQNQFGNNDYVNMHHSDSYYVRNIVNRFSQIKDGKVQRIVPVGDIHESLYSNRKSYNVRGQIDYDTSFINHQVNAIIGAEIRDSKMESNSSLLYGYDADKLTFSNINTNIQYPSLFNLFGNNYIPNGINLNRYTNRFISIYANAAYSYSNRYIITTSLRKDASNLFGVSTNQKWNPFWSLGGLWHLSKESFFSSRLFNKLSVRGTYGSSGNIPAGATALTQINYYSASYSPVNESFASIFMGPNPSLRWETVNTANFAIDFDMFRNGFLSGSIEYYTKNSKELFNATQLDPIIGMSIQSKNSASMNGNGVDLNISIRAINRNITWKSLFLASYSTYKVTKNLDPPSLEGLVSSGRSIFPIEGYNPYLLVSYKWAGLNPENGNPRGYYKGEISEDYSAMLSNTLDEQVIHGSAISPIYGSWRNDITWRNWSFVVGVSFKSGHYFRKHTLNYGTLFQYGESNGNEDYAYRWREKGDELYTDIPSLQYPVNARRDNFYRNAAINVQRGDHIRLNEVRFQYQYLTKAKNSIKSLTCYIFIDNMNVLLWKKNSFGLDPENLIGFKRPINYSVGLQLSL